MLKLRNVSKYYYQKGVIACGFSNVNLDFEIGEFVVITGESGSGKSTLLNIISGLDSYEEGEMYINKEETSHYTELDFFNYRKRYVANIFQNFNLINSYTVYQNIELVLLLNGYKKKEIRDKILSLIKQVGLEKYKNTKVAKLSGGQKQRVAIARALAKDTPIIVLDEPTGNLDKKSASSVLKLLKEISENKLVILVTHDYEQVENYATRKIKMHDGKVVLDKQIKKVDSNILHEEASIKNITFINKFLLGLRNTFNIKPKFLLLFLVYFLLVLTLAGEYVGYMANNYQNSVVGYNSFFNDISSKRVVIKKKDGSVFTDLDYDKINKLDNVENIIYNDLQLDNVFVANNGDFYISLALKDIKLLKDRKLDIGSWPSNNNEVIIETYEGSYYLNNIDNILNQEFIVKNQNESHVNLDEKVKIVGIKYNNDFNSGTDVTFYANSKIVDNLNKYNGIYYSDIEIIINNNKFNADLHQTINLLYPSSKIKQGSMVISDGFNYYCQNNNCKNSKSLVKVNSLYYNDMLELNIIGSYDKTTFNNYVSDLNYDIYSGIMIINDVDYYNLFNKGNYQSSVFVSNDKDISKTLNKLGEFGYECLYLKDTLINPYGDFNILSNVILLFVIVVLLLFVFFVTYFVIRLILKSRNVYFATLRTLGASKKTLRQLINMELINVASFAYVSFLILILLNKLDILKSTLVSELVLYLKFKDYIILYVILIVMSILLALRYAKKVFEKSTMKTLKEEV